MRNPKVNGGRCQFEGLSPREFRVGTGVFLQQPDSPLGVDFLQLILPCEFQDGALRIALEWLKPDSLELDVSRQGCGQQERLFPHKLNIGGICAGSHLRRLFLIIFGDCSALLLHVPRCVVLCGLLCFHIDVAFGQNTFDTVIVSQ